MGGGQKGGREGFEYDPVRGLIVRTRSRLWTRADPEALRRELVAEPGSQKNLIKDHLGPSVTNLEGSKKKLSKWFYLAQIRHYGTGSFGIKQRHKAKAMLTTAIKEAEGSLLRVPGRVLKIESNLKLEYERKKIEEEEEKEKLKRHTQSVYIISRKRKADVMENIDRRSKKSRQDELACDSSNTEESTEMLITRFLSADRTHLFNKYPDSLGKYDIICPKMAPRTDRVFELEVSPSSKGDLLWGAFHCTDVFRFRLEVTSAVSDMVSNSKPVVGTWQSRSQLNGPENLFSITFLGDGKICGLMHWKKVGTKPFEFFGRKEDVPKERLLNNASRWEGKWMKGLGQMSDSERDSDDSDEAS